jgi:hypothetical protein
VSLDRKGSKKLGGGDRKPLVRRKQKKIRCATRVSPGETGPVTLFPGHKGSGEGRGKRAKNWEGKKEGGKGENKQGKGGERK